MKKKIKEHHSDVHGIKNNMYGKRRTNDEIIKIKINMNKPQVIYCFENEKTYLSLRLASEDLNIDKSQLAKVCKNKIKSAKGYHFKYITMNKKENTNGI